jgi:O-antigen/teichoic acid export membrane protein
MNLVSMIASAQVEMLVRLVGGIVAWQLGFGLEGIVAAIALSVAAGWIATASDLPLRWTRPAPGMGRALAVAALPFGALQVAQVVLLDAEVLVARMMLRPESAGVAAALALFQRIEFFACFAMASVLLPKVSAAIRAGDGQGASTVRSVGLLYLLVTGPILLAAVLIPETVMTVLVGPAYAEAAPLLWLAATAAAAFTLAYLAATHLAATGHTRGIWLIAAAVPVQLGLFAVTAGGGLQALLWIKMCCLLALALLTCSIAFLSRPRF